MKGFAPGDSRAINAGRLGGHASGQARLRKDAQLLTRCGSEADAVAVLRDVRRRAYQAGWRAGRRRAA
jgi:hypothetical protein